MWVWTKRGYSAHSGFASPSALGTTHYIYCRQKQICREILFIAHTELNLAMGPHSPILVVVNSPIRGWFWLLFDPPWGSYRRQNLPSGKAWLGLGYCNPYLITVIPVRHMACDAKILERYVLMYIYQKTLILPCPHLPSCPPLT
jgi:hypothetical protein